MMKRKVLLIALICCLVFGLGLAACDKTQPEKETIAFETAEYRLDKYDMLTLKAVVKDGEGNPLEREIVYTSSDPSVASVDGDLLLGLKAGTATLTAVSGDLEATASVVVAEGDNVPRIEFGVERLELLIGSSLKIQPQITFKGSDYTDATFTFESADPEIAEVAADGTVHAVAYGETAVIVTAEWRGTKGGADLTEEISVKVNENVSLKLEGGPFELYSCTLPDEEGIRSTVPVTAIVKEDNKVVEDAEIIWETEDESVAAVTEQGEGYILAAYKPGTTRIRAKYVTSNQNTVTTEWESVSVSFPVIDKRDSISLLIDLSADGNITGQEVFGEAAITQIEDITGEVKPISVSDGSPDKSTLDFGVQIWRVYNADYAYEVEMRVATAVIGDKAGLAGWLAKANVGDGYDGYFELSDDIDYGGDVFVTDFVGSWPSGDKGFRGIFDGRGHTIGNIAFNHFKGMFVGLSTKDEKVGTVRNVAFDVVLQTSSGGNTSVIGAFNNGCIDNVLINVREAGERAAVIASTMSTQYIRGSLTNTIVYLAPSVPAATTLVEAGNFFAGNSTVSNAYVVGNMTDAQVSGVTVLAESDYDGAGMTGLAEYWDLTSALPAFKSMQTFYSALYSQAQRTVSLQSEDSIDFATQYLFGLSEVSFTARYEDGSDCEGYAQIDGNRLRISSGFDRDFTVVVTLTSLYYPALGATVTANVEAFRIETLAPATWAVYNDLDETEDFSVADDRLENLTIGEVSLYQGGKWQKLEGVSAEISGNVLTLAGSVMQTLPTGATMLRFTADNNTVYEIEIKVVTKVIKTSEEFARMLSYVKTGTSYVFDGYLELGANIDFGGAVYNADTYGVNGWASSDSSINFRGTFDGKGYTVYNIVLSNCSGLFGGIAATGVVKNTAFQAVTLRGETPVLIGGFNYGTIDNISAWIFDADECTGGRYAVCVGNKGTISNSAFIAFKNTQQIGDDLLLYAMNYNGTSTVVSGSLFITDQAQPSPSYQEGMRLYSAQDYKAAVADLRAEYFNGYVSEYWNVMTDDNLPLFNSQLTAMASLYASEALSVQVRPGGSVKVLPDAIFANSELGELPDSAVGKATLEGNLLTIDAGVQESFTFAVAAQLKVVAGESAHVFASSEGAIQIIVSAAQQIQLNGLRFDQDGGEQTAALEVADEAFAGMDGAAVRLDGAVCETAAVGGGKLTVPADVLNAVLGGEHTITVSTPEKTVTCSVLVITKIITTPEEFGDLMLYARTSTAMRFDGYFELGAPIDMSGIVYDIECGGELKIGTSISGWPSGANQGFFGVFDGRGYTVSHLTFKSWMGIFGGIGASGVVRNVTFEADNLGKETSVIATLSFGTIENVLINVQQTEAEAAYIVTGSLYSNSVLKNCVVVLGDQVQANAKTVNIVQQNVTTEGLVLLGTLDAAAPFTGYSDAAAFAASSEYEMTIGAFNAYWNFAEGVPSMQPLL